jgi:hypothetical protein
MLVPSLASQITGRHTLSSFPVGIRKSLAVRNSGGQRQLFEEQNSYSCFNNWRWHGAAHMSGARISLVHYTCGQWCPCWMFVIFRTNFEFMSRKWCVSNILCIFMDNKTHKSLENLLDVFIWGSQ